MRKRHFIAKMVLLASLCSSLPGARGEANEQNNSLRSVGIYHHDPNHLWNRLFVTFYRQQISMYRSPGERSRTEQHWIGPDVLDPPVGCFLLDDVPFAKANLILDEFSNKQGASLIDDPVKRVTLQRDLWAVFDLLASTISTNVLQRPLTSAQQERRLVLRGKIAQIIRSLALARAQIEKLPDTYDAAIRSGAFSNKPDETNFLPSDLFAANSGWVEIQTGRNLLMHTAAAGGRSLFRTFVKLPPGSTNVLADYIQRWAVERASGIPPSRVLPVGTQLLLLREMICLDENLKMAPTHIVESVQFRTTRKGLLSEPLIAHEAELNRDLLFQGKQGGLRPILNGEPRIVGFGVLDRLLDDKGNARPLVSFPKACGMCHPPRRLESGGQASAAPVRSPSIDPINQWKEKRGDLNVLRDFISSPADGQK
jgi:hypothetical protein